MAAAGGDLLAFVRSQAAGHGMAEAPLPPEVCAALCGPDNPVGSVRSVHCARQSSVLVAAGDAVPALRRGRLLARDGGSQEAPMGASDPYRRFSHTPDG